MRLCSIASGSSGNCIYVGSDDTHLLVDAGISAKRIEEGLNSIDLSFRDIDGILITHEHTDHIQGIGVISRKAHIPIYATRGTIQGIKNCRSLGSIGEELFRCISSHEAFIINDIRISPMEVSHDALEPVAYTFEGEGRKIGIATDLGMWDEYTVSGLKDMDLLFLEANHDVRMLEMGRYPYPLKQRILGELGHLSNEMSGRLLCRLIHSGLNGVMLGHLSRENNMPELAYETVRCEVTMHEGDFHRIGFPLKVANRDRVSDIMEV